MLAKYRALIDSTEKLEHRTAQQTLNPILVGGVGGSGTRLLSMILREAGHSLGGLLKKHSLDNLFWPPVKTLLLSRVARHNSGSMVLNNAFAIFEEKMNDSEDYDPAGAHPWVSKVPACYLFLEELAAYFPQMKYVHLVRHGLDMAFAKNRLQLGGWGFYFGVFQDFAFQRGHRWSEEDVLDYWIRANNYAIEVGERVLGDRFLVMSFDDLCLNPKPNLAKLLAFAGHDPDSVDIDALAALVKVPRSLGRHRNHDCKSLFRQDQIEAVRRLGFAVG
jgi:hypothetical protein